MVYARSLAVLCSALVGMSNAASLGTAEEYADGTVHARIMGLKVVRCLRKHVEVRRLTWE
jgi:hypothetical protein